MMTRRTWLLSTVAALGTALIPRVVDNPLVRTVAASIPRLRVRPLRRADIHRAHPWAG